MNKLQEQIQAIESDIPYYDDQSYYCGYLKGKLEVLRKLQSSIADFAEKVYGSDICEIYSMKTKQEKGEPSGD
jgi:hypothetical protein